MKKATPSKTSAIIVLVVMLTFTFGKAQNSALAKWTANYERSRSFIENKGQFVNHDSKNDAPVLFAVDNGSTMIYFTRKGITYSFLKTWKEEDEEGESEEEKKKKITTAAEYRQMEVEEHKLEFEKDVVDMFWENANPDAEIVGEQTTSDYHSYTYEDNGKQTSINFIKGYKKIVYKNIYPHIDAEYTFHPKSGIKYALIMHPGADPGLIKMRYSKKLNLDENNSIHIPTKFGDITDSAPLSFYQDQQQSVVESEFVIKGRSASFKLGNYDRTKTLVIDPWTQTPAFATNWDCVWECERDAAGNVYIIGGVMPLQLLKYNTAGILQWTYNTPYDTTSWLGTFATDLAGNSYVTRGSTAAIVKVSTAGGVLWNNTNPGGPFSSMEFWNIAFNCDQTKLIVGGTGGTLPPLPFIYNINMSNGNITSSQQVTGGQLIPTQEVRSITAATNGRYYFLTHDSLGYINQNFSLCPSGTTLFKINNSYSLGYKCEDYRKDNSGIMAIRANGNFVYTVKGNQVHKRSLATGAIVGTAAVAGGGFLTGFGGNQVQNSGIDIDVCGNVYVGSGNAVIKYDANLNVLSSVATTFKVYDVHVNTAGEVVICGTTGNSGTGTRTGTVQTINMSACAPMTQVCCDATVCKPNNLCVSDPAINLTAGSAGGTWSGTGITNTATGSFNPATAGVGTHTVYYDLPCGRDSTTIIVSPCIALSICRETNGTLTVSNGTAPYTWEKYMPASTTNITNSAQCTACGYSWTFGTCLNGITPVTTCNTPAYWTSFATGTNSGTLPGTYPIRVKDASGTIVTLNTAADVAALPACATSCPPLTVTPASQVNVLCFGQSTGSFNASTTGGASPYDYTLLNGTTTVSSFSNIAGSQTFGSLPAGTYTLNVLDNNGCPGTTSITITQPANAVAVTISGSVQSTCGLSNGSATATASGGSSPYDYVWTGPTGTLQTTNNITTSNTLSGLAAGTYTITVTDNNSCTTTSTVNITTSVVPAVNISAQTNVLCFGGSTGDLTATASSGGSPYDYVWTNVSGTLQTTNNIAGSNTLSGLQAGTYSVTVTDNSGCSTTTSATITQPASAATVAITSSTNASCGSSNGSATATASGGSSPYDYVWTGSTGIIQTTNNVAGANTVSNLAAGTYTITITDNNNCVSTATASITSTGGAAVNIDSQTNVLCFGTATGASTASANGGSSPYDFVWSGTSGTLQTTNNITVPDNITGLAAGTYTVSVTDNSGCINTNTVTITEPATAATVSITGTTTTPCGSSTGSVTANASGGTSPYDYVWTGTTGTLQTTNNVTTSDVLNGLTAGTYTVTITDANGCTNTASATVTSSNGATVTITTQNNVLCFGGNTGDATATANGGTSPYDYAWTGASGTLQTSNNVSGSNTLSNLSAGSYTVTVTDNGGCISTTSFSITQPATLPVVVVTSTTPAACGSSNGSATAQSSGGSGPYDFVWSGTTGTIQSSPNIVSTDVINNLASGTYTVTITDNNGCINSTTAVISNSGGATTTITSQTNVSCFGGSNGTATANTTGGTSPYDYVWTGASGTIQTTNNISVPDNAINLQSGTYTVSVTDNGGCISSATVTITQPSTAVNVTNGTVTHTTCGLNNGSSTVIANGGTGAYTFNWLPTGGTSATANSLAGTTYTITVTDANGCSSTTTSTINTSAGVSLVLSSLTNISCNGSNDGSASVTASGGSGTYSYSWTGVTSTSATASALSAGTYTITATSGTCSGTTTATISQPAPITVTVTTNPANCSDSSGSATVVANGGNGVLSPLWSNSATTSTVTNIPAGTYSVTITDVNGCTQSATGVVGSTGGITATASAQDLNIIAGQSTTLFATGGTVYQWDLNSNMSCTNCQNPVVSPLESTTYCVTADSATCVDSACVRINVELPCPTNKDLAVPNAFSPNQDGHNDIFCLRGWSHCIQTFTIYIYDRWGEKVFESDDASFCWDGTYRGKALDPSVFVYFINATFTNDTKIESKGNISLIR